MNLRHAPLLFASLFTSCSLPAAAPAASVASPTATLTLLDNTPVIYTTSPAPATLHIHALNLLTQPADWLNEQYAWNFGDPAPQKTTDPRTGQPVNLNTGLTGPVAAYPYENPGNYTVTLTRTLADGHQQTVSLQVTVPASKRSVYYISSNGNDSNTGTDIAHPWQTAAFAASKTADHTEFRFRRGDFFPLNREFALKHEDLVIDCYGDPSLPLPVLKRIPNAPKPAPATTTATIATPTTNPGEADDPTPLPSDLVFSFWPGASQDVTVRHLRLDSPYLPAMTTGKYAFHASSTSFGILRGRNVTVADCEFLNLLEGPHCDTTLSGGLMLRNRQIDPVGISSRTLWLEGSDIVAIGNVALNSVGESPLRAAASGIVRGLIAFNDVAQQLDPAHNRSLAKAAVTLRTLQDVRVANNRISSGEFAFDPLTAAAQDLRISVEDNAVYNSFLHVKSNVRQAAFNRNTVQRDGGPCITVSAGNDGAREWIEDLRMNNNTGCGWESNGRMLQIDSHSDNALRLFNFDAAKNPYTKMPTPTTSPTTKPLGSK